MNKRYQHPKLPYKDPKVMAHLFGLGLDCTDGHKRITQAEKFSIFGGSQNTHDKMTETLLKHLRTSQSKVNPLKKHPWMNFQT